MKILYYFPEQSNPMMQWQRVHFIDELSRYNIEFEVFNPLLFNSVDDACQELVKHIKSQKYDLFLANLCNELHIHTTAVDEIRRMGLPTMSFRSDNLSMPYNDKEMASHFDLLWLTSKETQHLFDRWGAKTMFAPFAANPFVYKYEQGELIRKACFIGTPYGSRAKMINTISRSGNPVDLYFGRNKNTPPPVEDKIEIKYTLPFHSAKTVYWNRLKYHEGRKLVLSSLINKLSKGQELDKNASVTIRSSVPFEDMVRFYTNYALAISFTSTETSDVLRHPVGRTFLRTFEVPMAGGIQICRYFDELNDYFEDGKEIIMYKTDEELVEKTNYILTKATEAEIIKMKEAARRRSESEHTWMNRFKTAFEILGLKY